MCDNGGVRCSSMERNSKKVKLMRASGFRDRQLAQDCSRDGILVQKTAGVLQQMLSAEAGLAGYQDVFIVDVVFALLR